MKNSENYNIRFKKEIIDEIHFLYFEIESPEKRIFTPMSLEITGFPGKGAHSYWRPAQARNKNVVMCWGEGDIGEAVKGTISAPVGVFYDLNGNNVLSAAYSNILEDVNFKMGIIEEKGELIIKLGLFPYPTKQIKKYSGIIRLDMRNTIIEEVIKDISKWYEKDYTPMKAPSLAKEPMYSTWYSYHQDLTSEDIEKEANLAKTLGMNAIIVDDGWQTDDNNRGYAYCGDWEVSSKRIPDMKKHVKNVHKLGMKYLLWYSVPFMGIHAKAWDKFKDKLLYFREELGAGVLDPRYKEVRSFLISKYIQAVKEWGVDGLKLDFVDEFHQGKATGNALKFDENRDFHSVQEAVEELLKETLNELTKIKKDILIEFRQRYIGPLMRKYGNIFRVNDCPLDFITNRMGISDLKLFSGNTVIHSDMIMWDLNDSPEGASLQFINILFGVPQFSMRLEELSEEHLKLSKFWLKFWNENKKTLLDGEFKVQSPEYLYPVLKSEDSLKEIIGVYENKIIKVNLKKETILINGKLENDLYIELETKKLVNIITLNCLGEKINEKNIKLNCGINKLEVPKCGIVYIKN
jgi:alpha-galactosidase